MNWGIRNRLSNEKQEVVHRKCRITQKICTGVDQVIPFNYKICCFRLFEDNPWLQIVEFMYEISGIYPQF